MTDLGNIRFTADFVPLGVVFPGLFSGSKSRDWNDPSSDVYGVRSSKSGAVTYYNTETQTADDAVHPGDFFIPDGMTGVVTPDRTGKLWVRPRASYTPPAGSTGLKKVYSAAFAAGDFTSVAGRKEKTLPPDVTGYSALFVTVIADSGGTAVVSFYVDDVTDKVSGAVMKKVIVIQPTNSSSPGASAIAKGTLSVFGVG